MFTNNVHYLQESLNIVVKYYFLVIKCKKENLEVLFSVDTGQ